MHFRTKIQKTKSAITESSGIKQDTNLTDNEHVIAENLCVSFYRSLEGELHIPLYPGNQISHINQSEIHSLSLASQSGALNE